MRNSKTRIVIALLLTLSLAASMFAFASVDQNISFSDVKEGAWYYADVMALAKSGGITGYPDSTFKPNGTITAAEFVKITVAIIAPINSTITGKDWYKPYAEKAVEIGIVPDGMFDDSEWNKPIPREKMSVIMELSAQKVLKEGTMDDADKLSILKGKFKDYNSICDYCKDYVIQAVARGLLEGYPDGTFKPNGNATRAEASTMIIRLVADSKRLSVSYGANLEPIADIGKFTGGSYFNGIEGFFCDDPAMFELKFDECIYMYGRMTTWFYWNGCGAAYAIMEDGTDDQSAFNRVHNERLHDYFEADVNDIKYVVISDRNTQLTYVLNNPFI